MVLTGPLTQSVFGSLKTLSIDQGKKMPALVLAVVDPIQQLPALPGLDSTPRDPGTWCSGPALWVEEGRHLSLFLPGHHSDLFLFDAASGLQAHRYFESTIQKIFLA